MDGKHATRGVRLGRVCGWLILLAGIGLVASSASCSAPSRAAAVDGMKVAAGVCGGSPVSVVSSGEASDQELVIDGSESTASQLLRREYLQAALAVIGQAALAGSSVTVVVFGPSGVGARVVFAGSFAPVSTVLAFNLAATNRLKCLAEAALTRALLSGWREVGSDVAGAIAVAIQRGALVVKHDGPVAVTVLTDGCQAPAPSGPNRGLTDVCGLLARGVSPERILVEHRAEFTLGGGAHVSVRIEGLGVGRSAAEASTAAAEALSRFWRLACARSGIGRCVMGSELP